jgi:hypothetical protein
MSLRHGKKRTRAATTPLLTARIVHCTEERRRKEVVSTLRVVKIRVAKRAEIASRGA